MEPLLKRCQEIFLRPGEGWQEGPSREWSSCQETMWSARGETLPLRLRRVGGIVMLFCRLGGCRGVCFCLSALPRLACTFVCQGQGLAGVCGTCAVPWGEGGGAGICYGAARHCRSAWIQQPSCLAQFHAAVPKPRKDGCPRVMGVSSMGSPVFLAWAGALVPVLCEYDFLGCATRVSVYPLYVSFVVMLLYAGVHIHWCLQLPYRLHG